MISKGSMALSHLALSEWSELCSSELQDETSAIQTADREVGYGAPG